MTSVYGTIGDMNDQRTYLTIPEISKRTGRSETTVRRWLEKVKKLNPESILKEDHKNYFTYKVEMSMVDQHFNKTSMPNVTQTTRGESTPDGYILVHESTLAQIQDQIESAKNNAIKLHEELAEKNKQIKQLLETNTKVSGFIADMGRQALLPDSPEDSQGLTESVSRHVSDVNGTTTPVKQETTGNAPIVKQQKTTKKRDKQDTGRNEKRPSKKVVNDGRKSTSTLVKKSFLERIFG